MFNYHHLCINVKLIPETLMHQMHLLHQHALHLSLLVAAAVSLHSLSLSAAPSLHSLSLSATPSLHSVSLSAAAVFPVKM